MNMPASPPANILIVDDDLGLLRLLASTLKREGFATMEVNSGREAISWLTQNSVDLMLLDLKLPDIEGKKLINDLAAFGRSVPFIVITGQGDERIAVDMMKRGALDYLAKDVQFIEFVPTVVRRALTQIEKEKRLAFAEMQARLTQTVVEQSYSAVMIVSNDETDPVIYYVNPAFLTLTGCPSEKIIGNHLSDLEPLLTGPWEWFRSVLSAGRPFIGEFQFCSNQGRQLIVDCAISRVRNPSGVQSHWVVNFHDVTERRRLEREILEISDREQSRIGEPRERKVAILFDDVTGRKQTESALLSAKSEIAQHAFELEKVVAERNVQLREMTGELEMFSHSVAHDMRAPLRAMQGFASCLVDEYGGKLDEQGVNYLQQIMRSAVRLDRLIRDVLSYSRILHAGLPMGSVDLDRLTRDIIEAFRTGQPVQPEIQIKEILPIVWGNEALLAQCVMNLLSNGVKFVSPRTTPQIEISHEVMGDASIRVWFKDNGNGIAPENHTRIFRLFEQIYPSTEYDGTGVGLTIVRKAVERMGGQIGFESELDKGSRFWIQLKRAESPGWQAKVRSRQKEVSNGLCEMNKLAAKETIKI